MSAESNREFAYEEVWGAGRFDERMGERADWDGLYASYGNTLSRPAIRRAYESGRDYESRKQTGLVS